MEKCTAAPAAGEEEEGLPQFAGSTYFHTPAASPPSRGVKGRKKLTIRQVRSRDMLHISKAASELKC